jgi:hypothetical protein
MTMTNLTSNGSCATNIVRSAQTFNFATPNSRDCDAQINRVVAQIESHAVREIVDVVFNDLLRLLECLNLIEVHLRKVEFADQTFELFQLIHDEARVLVDFIHAKGLNPEIVTPELFDTLDGIAFAVNHDLRRVFEATPRASATNNSHAVIGRLYRAHDVLTNCLQQSAITLAMVFNPELDGTKLFNNSDMRFRQSLQLCEELGQLIQLVSASEDNPKQTEYDALAEGIQKFRNESMELLMYSDWPQFETLCERIDPQQEPQQLPAVLHQFRCYLETLLGQVRMRAVLANVFPLGFGDNHFSSPISDQAHIADGALDWNRLAVAV